MLAFSLENLLLPVFPLPPLLFLHHATSLLHLAQVIQSREGPLPTLGVSGGGGESEGSVTAGEDRVALYTYVYVGCLYIPTYVHT